MEEFRITDCLTNGGRIEVAQSMAGGSTAKPPASTAIERMTSASPQWRRSGFETMRAAGKDEAHY
jgi:hypothetical protein